MPEQMDALQFTTDHLSELQERLSHIDYSLDGVNFGDTETQIVQRFLDDQGYEFTNVDIPSLLTLAKG